MPKSFHRLPYFPLPHQPRALFFEYYQDLNIKMHRYSHLHDGILSTMGPLSQLDENIFTSSPMSLRRLSESSSFSCTTNPSSPAAQTPKSEGGSSPLGLGENSLGDIMARFQGLGPHYGQSIAPRLLSIDSHHDNHGANALYNTHDELLQQDQLEHIEQALIRPQQQCNQSSIIRCQGSIDSFIDISQTFSWGPGTSPSAAAMTALQCAREEYSEDCEMSSEASCQFSTSPIPEYSPPPPQPRKLVLPPPAAKPQRSRRASQKEPEDPEDPEETARIMPVVVSNKDHPHGCPVGGCQRRFKRQEHLRRHERTHTGEKPYKCSVKECGRFFSRTDNLGAHRKTHMKKVGGRNIYVPGLELKLK